MANWHLSCEWQKCPAFTPCTSALQWFEVDAMDGRGGLWGYQWKIAAMAFEACMASARIHGRYLAALHPDDL